ncbi:hypothetical protein HanRHA438_Chr03g0101591 [Helianthus annuus]|nr:hypothetical protein HanRHA438_Chr03g0101591 [Helianthus annuus]
MRHKFYSNVLDRELLIPVANTADDDDGASSKPSSSSMSSSHNSGREGLLFYRRRRRRRATAMAPVAASLPSLTPPLFHPNHLQVADYI